MDNIVDFYCKEKDLIIELDGEHHKDQFDYDHVRDTFLKSLNFQVLRFWNHEIRESLDQVIVRIKNHL